MVDLIDREKLIQTIRNTHLFDISYGRKNGKIVLAEQISKLFSDIENQLIAIIISQPKVDTERHAHSNNCLIGNSELDESWLGGLWDISREIEDKSDCYIEATIIFEILLEWIKSQPYCCKCGCKKDEVSK